MGVSIRHCELRTGAVVTLTYDTYLTTNKKDDDDVSGINHVYNSDVLRIRKTVTYLTLGGGRITHEQNVDVSAQSHSVS